MVKQRVLSGMRPTGKLHLGHYYGALENWRDLQQEYECFYFAADWHALTTDYADTREIKENTRELILDLLAAGIDPKVSTVFIQSEIKEHAELNLLLSMITPLSWLEGNPTYKEQMEELSDKELHNFGFLGYPVLQAADIIIYKAQFVPVGEDQRPHLELTRRIARRFNNFYREVFPEPRELLTEMPKLPGTDGRKMSKSYNNAIFLTDPPEVVEEKIKPMVTDTRRARRTDPGEAEDCPVFSYHRLYSSPEVIAEVSTECRRAGIGCLDCKGKIIPRINEFLAPFQAERKRYQQSPAVVDDILEQGNKKARQIAQATMEEVREAMGI